MPTAPPQSAQYYQGLYLKTVQEAAAGGSVLMGKLVAAARTALQAREAACRDLRERDALAQSSKYLATWESELCKRYPQALLAAFDSPGVGKAVGSVAKADVEFGELELMDEVQVLTSVTMARAQQIAMLAAEASLTELNTLICTTLGLKSVHAERNPLRPQIYVNALKAVVEQTNVPTSTQLDWLAAMGATLGQELRNMYELMCRRLRDQGVVAAGYAVLQTPSSQGVGRALAQEINTSQTIPTPNSMTPHGDAHHAAHPRPAAIAPGSSSGAPLQRASDATLLTLDMLRRLLAGELEPVQPMTPLESFAQQFSRQFEDRRPVVESASTEFDATVPAALEALKEMKQVDEVVQRLQSRQGGKTAPGETGDTSVQAIRAQLRAQSRGIAQSLSLEVITLMVDNIANDARLLEPIQQLIRQLEPPLLRLALVDPRLFTDKQHPARVLVQEIADHSLAYASPSAPGFVEFTSAIEEAFLHLTQVPIESAEPFERVLGVLRDEWQEMTRKGRRSMEEAVQALEQAEARNVLAEKIAREIMNHPDAAAVPAVITDFLCGPWVQVVAQARLAGVASSANAEKYHALISALLWSTHPNITRKDAPKLTRLVPPLLGTLREGLDTIHYPSIKTSAFFEALMGLHQRAFRAESAPVPPVKPQPTIDAPTRVHLVDDGNPWVAPSEAQASNFIELPDAPVDSKDVLAFGQEVQAKLSTTSNPTESVQVDGSSFELGTWVELLVNDQWLRTQLTWASPHGTLFLFTSATGTPQSMTRRSRDKLLAAGQLRLISGRPVVEGALNVVAQMAMRNSVNTLI